MATVDTHIGRASPRQVGRKASLRAPDPACALLWLLSPSPLYTPGASSPRSPLPDCWLLVGSEAGVWEERQPAWVFPVCSASAPCLPLTGSKHPARSLPPGLVFSVGSISLPPALEVIKAVCSLVSGCLTMHSLLPRPFLTTHSSPGTTFSSLKSLAWNCIPCQGTEPYSPEYVFTEEDSSSILRQMVMVYHGYLL